MSLVWPLLLDIPLIRRAIGRCLWFDASLEQWQKASVRERLGTLWLVLAVRAGGGAHFLAPQTAIAAAGCCLRTCSNGAACSISQDLSVASCQSFCEQACATCLLSQASLCPEGSAVESCSTDPPVCLANCVTHTPTATPTQTPTITPTSAQIHAPAPTFSRSGLLLLALLLCIAGVAVVRRRHAR